MYPKINLSPFVPHYYYTLQDHLNVAIKNNLITNYQTNKIYTDILDKAKDNIRLLLDIPEDLSIFITTSLHEIWDLSIKNLIDKNASFFLSGTHSKSFYDYSKYLNINSNCIKIKDGYNENNIHSIQNDFISFSLDEVDTGYCISNDIIQNIRNRYPNAIISIDGTYSFPVFKFDFNIADSVYFKVNGLFGVPSGLCVWIVNQRSIDKSKSLLESNPKRKSHFDLVGLTEQKFSFKERFNTLDIYLLEKISEDLLYKGGKQLQNEAIYKSTIIYQAIEQSENLFNYHKGKEKSKTVISFQSNFDSEKVIDLFSKKRMILGQSTDNQLSLLNSPSFSKELFEQIADLLQTI